MRVRKSDLVAVVATGTFAGVQLMIGVSYAADWRAMDSAQLMDGFVGDWSRIAMTVIPFAILQTMFLPLSAYLARGNRSARRMWITALGLWIANCAITATYHFPVVLEAMDEGYTRSEIAAVVSQWMSIHWLRIVIGYLTFLAAVLAALRCADDQRAT